jgi:hypothetical protein
MRHHSGRPSPATYPVIWTILLGHIQTTLQGPTRECVYAVTRRTRQLIQTVRHSIPAAKSLHLLRPLQNHSVCTSVTNPSHLVSLHNSSFRRHTRNRASNDSGSSIAHAYSNYGANGGRAVGEASKRRFRGQRLCGCCSTWIRRQNVLQRGKLLWRAIDIWHPQAQAMWICPKTGTIITRVAL